MKLALVGAPGGGERAWRRRRVWSGESGEVDNAMVLAKMDECDWLRKHLDAEGLKRLSTPDGLGIAM